MQRTTEQMIAWYRSHETTSQIGFNPDGMCLKVCRYARNIGSMFPTAVSSQHATPAEHRVHKVEDIRKGMVIYFDDTSDGNPFGHIATVMGRRDGIDRGSLASLITRTNSVKSGRVVPVAADYYQRFWGDEFQFAATWLNGVVLDMPDKPRPQPPTLPSEGKKRLHRVVDILDEMIDNHRSLGHERIVRALRRDKRAIRQTLERWGGR